MKDEGFFPDEVGRGGKRGVRRKKEVKQKYLEMKHPGIFKVLQTFPYVWIRWIMSEMSEYKKQ